MSLHLITPQPQKIPLEFTRTPIVILKAHGNCICGNRMIFSVQEPLKENLAVSCECGRLYSLLQEGESISAIFIKHINMKG